MRTIPIRGLVLALLFAGAAPLAAQESRTLPSHEIDIHLADRVGAEQADRERILRFLERPDVQATAERYGVDLHLVRGAAESLDGEGLQDVVSQIDDLEEALEDRVTISLTTTAIIVILALVILLVVIT